ESVPVLAGPCYRPVYRRRFLRSRSSEYQEYGGLLVELGRAAAIHAELVRLRQLCRESCDTHVDTCGVESCDLLSRNGEQQRTVFRARLYTHNHAGRGVFYNGQHEPAPPPESSKSHRRAEHFVLDAIR